MPGHLLQLNGAGGLGGPREACQLIDQDKWHESFYLQIVDYTGDTVDLIADGARDILKRRVSKLRRIYNSQLKGG